MTQPLIIFTHIPKTAGTTLKRVIRAQFPRSAALDINAVPGAELPRILAELPETVRIVLGNARYGLHRYTTRPCRYFTMLREPVDRAISSYYHILREPSHHLHGKYTAEKIDLVTSERRFPNLQTKYIAGTAPGVEVDAAEFQRARENLEHAFEVFGLTEDFDTSLLFFIKAFAWDDQGYVRHNVNAARPAKSGVAENVLGELREASAYDVQLYDFARQLMAARIAQQPPTFQRDLGRLSRKAGWMETRHRLTAAARGWLARVGLLRA